MQVEVVDTLEGLAGLREEWEDLEQRDPEASFYLTHRFVSAWCHAYADHPDVSLHIVCVRHNAALMAVMPLSLRRGTRKGRAVTTLRFATHGDFMGALVDPTPASDAVCRTLADAMDQPRSWDSIYLTNIPVHSHLGRFFLRTEHNPRFTPHVEAPRIDLREYADFTDFCGRSLPSHTRKYRNKLFREHEVTFRVYTGDEDGVLDRIAAVHRAERDHLVERRARTERHSLFDDERRVTHLRAVFATGGDAVTFAYEDEDGQIVGYRTCFRQGRTLLSWNSAYAPAYDRYRLGKVIQYDILEHLFAEGSTDVFDFGAGRYPWKFEWTPRFTATYRYQRRLNPDPPVDAAARPAKATTPATPQPHTPVTTAASSEASTPTDGALLGVARQTARAVMRRSGLAAARHAGRETVARARGRRLPPIIWYVPHPDDESIFMGGSISRHRHRRNILVVLTQGGGSAVLPKVSAKLGQPLSVHDFMQGRLGELDGALTALGVRQRDVRQHQLTDGAVTAEQVYDLICTMAREFPDATHRTMSYLDPHRDHSAAGQALRQAYRNGVVTDAVFHLPIPLVPATWGTRAPLSVADVEVKRAALREYQRWDPAQGRYAIGEFSVGSVIRTQIDAPHERVHDPGYDI